MTYETVTWKTGKSRKFSDFSDLTQKLLINLLSNFNMRTMN